MLGYISQHNLTPQQQAMFIENFDASQEDKQFVIDDIKSREPQGLKDSGQIRFVKQK